MAQVYILNSDYPQESSLQWAMKGDIMILPASSAGRSQDMLQLERPSWAGQKGTVVCPRDKAVVITQRDALLLLPIGEKSPGGTSSYHRWKFFDTPGALDDAHKLSVGAAVTFEYYKAYCSMEAVIVFTGKIPSMGSGIRFGLEIMGSSADLKQEDICDGTVEGKKYFTCLPGRGVITSVENLTLNAMNQVKADRVMATRKTSREAMSEPAPRVTDRVLPGASSTTAARSQMPTTTRDPVAAAAATVVSDAGCVMGTAATNAMTSAPGAPGTGHGAGVRGASRRSSSNSSQLSVGMRARVCDRQNPKVKHSGTITRLETIKSGDGLDRVSATLEMDPPSFQGDGDVQEYLRTRTVPAELLEYDLNVLSTSTPVIHADIRPNGRTRLDNDIRTDHFGTAAAAGMSPTSRRSSRDQGNPVRATTDPGPASTVRHHQQPQSAGTNHTASAAASAAAVDGSVASRPGQASDRHQYSGASDSIPGSQYSSAASAASAASANNGTPGVSGTRTYASAANSSNDGAAVTANHRSRSGQRDGEHFVAEQQRRFDNLPQNSDPGLVREQERRLAQCNKTGSKDISSSQDLNAATAVVKAPGPGPLSNVPSTAPTSDLDIGSAAWADDDLPRDVLVLVSGRYIPGVIKWIGTSAGSTERLAGVELDEKITNSQDGYLDGKKRFDCAKNRGKFVPLDECKDRPRDPPVSSSHTSPSDSPPRTRTTTSAPPPAAAAATTTGGTSSSLSASATWSTSSSGAALAGRTSAAATAATAGASADSEMERSLRKLRTSMVPLKGDTIVHLPQKMVELGQSSRWRALVSYLGFTSTDLSALITGGESDEQCLLTVLWNWAENTPATFGQLARALSNVHCDGIAYDLLVPALRKAEAESVSSGAASSSRIHGTNHQSLPAMQESEPVRDTCPPANAIMAGRKKGIQGHHNSCYMDSTLFAMFAHSLAFDGTLHKAAARSEGAEGVRRHLLENIVNPLRKNGFVSWGHIMSLRRQFNNLGNVTDLTDAEKDPEEFLILMWEKILGADPFLKLKTPQQDGNSTFMHQLFVPSEGNKKIATVQELLEQSFSESQLMLREAPSVLILQMPRFGRTYKQFDKIIPSLRLNITNLLTEGSRVCGICEQAATVTCYDCHRDFKAATANADATSVSGVVAVPPAEQQQQQQRRSAGRSAGLLHSNDQVHINYCQVCSAQVHLNRRRRQHKPQPLERCDRNMRRDLVADKLETMELFAVICIETSHYVSFVKCNAMADSDCEGHDGEPGKQSEGKWCFFDSMADRVGEQDGYNIPEVKAMPDLVDWVSDLRRVERATSRDMPPEIRRLLSDPYMCLYQNTGMLMHS